jgi:hypothetical protein
VTPAAAFRELLGAFDRLNIPYLVTGSIASSFYGNPRATRDIDLAAEIRLDHVAPLVAALGGDFYADADMMSQAIAANRAFNLIHFATSYKFDIFPAGSDPYTCAQFQRRQKGRFAIENESVDFQLASAEDSILSKLVWYKSGGSVSEQQWRDVLSVLVARSGMLDLEYLHKWARHLEIDDLLDRALNEVV